MLHFARWRPLPLFTILLAAAFASWNTAGVSAADRIQGADTMRVYIAADGVHLYNLDLETGALTAQSAYRDAKPSFLAIHPSERFLYGVGKELWAFAIDDQTGHLSLLGQIPSEGGSACHLTVDQTGSNVLSASYGAGLLTVHRLSEDGRLGDRTALVRHFGSSVNRKRQEAAHAHSINLDANNAFAFAADLGLDKILIYRFDASRGTLEPADPPAVLVQPGAGPRHFTFHPSGVFAYGINELDSTISVFSYDASAGRLETIETKTTLPADFKGENYTAEIRVGPDGRYLYGSNRGHNSIAVFAIDETTGKLIPVQDCPCGGNWPRNFCIDPTGQFLLVANRKSDNVVVFHIDQPTGKLTRSAHEIKLTDPVCIRFLQPPRK